MMTKQDLNYWMMYHEIHQLKRNGSSTRQICLALGINFRTVRKYLLMTEEDFFSHLESQSYRYRKLGFYEEFVKNKLEVYPDTKAAQMHDWLKEHYPDFPFTCEKTVYNFVMYVRQKYSIPVQRINRDFFPVEELDYGYQSQADFGEYTMRRVDGSRKKVYFFSMVLSRSRFKFVYFSENPFDTPLSIVAHEKAFIFFQGFTVVVVYDQDSVFIHDENYGNLLLTREFKEYVKSRKIVVHFCRKADPQSKGKIENVIKYIKQNFLYNRTFVDIDTLNDQAISWLSRTANIMVHNRTRKVPLAEWQFEKQCLKPYTPLPVDYNPYASYCVRKDNTIAYKGNFYTLPEGTYKGKGSSVLINVTDSKINIYTRQKEIICTHPLSNDKGRIIRNTDHKRDKTLKIRQLTDQITAYFEEPEMIVKFIEGVHNSKPRYIRDQLLLIRKTIETEGTWKAFKALQYCYEHQIYDATAMRDMAEKMIKPEDELTKIPFDLKLLINPENLKKANTRPLKSNIEDYENLFLNN